MVSAAAWRWASLNSNDILEGFLENASLTGTWQS
jgi:hypothetical protein